MKFTIKGLIKEGLDPRSFNMIEAIADKYSYGEILDALESFYIKNDEQNSARMASVHAKEFRRVLDMPNPFEKLNEDKKDIKEKVTDFLTSEGVKYQIATGIGVIIAGLMRNPDLIDKFLSLIGLKEGSCGYSADGNINVNDTSSNTPGGLKSMPADKRTLIVKKLMKEIKSKKS